MANEKERIGYGAPPRETRFVRGKSGNPGGRPRKLPTLGSDLEAELAEEVQLLVDGKHVSVSKQRAVIKRVVAAALAGNLRAANTVIELARAPSERAAAEEEQTSDEAILDEFLARELERRSGGSEPQGGGS